MNAFHLPLSVSNYPMKERTKSELEEIQYVTNQRRIEQAETEASKNVVSGPTSARNTPLVVNTPPVGKNRTILKSDRLGRHGLIDRQKDRKTDSDQQTDLRSVPNNKEVFLCGL